MEEDGDKGLLPRQETVKSFQSDQEAVMVTVDSYDEESRFAKIMGKKRSTELLRDFALRKTTSDRLRTRLVFTQNENYVEFYLKSFSSEVPDFKMTPINLNDLNIRPLSLIRNTCNKFFEDYIRSIKVTQQYFKQQEKSTSRGFSGLFRIFRHSKFLIGSSVFTVTSTAVLTVSRVIMSGPVAEILTIMSGIGLGLGLVGLGLSVTSVIVAHRSGARKIIFSAIDALEKETQKICDEIYLKLVVLIRLKKLFEGMPELKIYLPEFFSILENDNRIVMWEILNQHLKLVLSPKHEFVGILRKRLYLILFDLCSNILDVSDKCNAIIDCLISLPFFVFLKNLRDYTDEELIKITKSFFENPELYRVADKFVQKMSPDLPGRTKNRYNLGKVFEEFASNAKMSSQSTPVKKGAGDEKEEAESTSEISEDVTRVISQPHHRA